jgi:hypothetical protein
MIGDDDDCGRMSESEIDVSDVDVKLTVIVIASAWILRCDVVVMMVSVIVVMVKLLSSDLTDSASA